MLEAVFPIDFRSVAGAVFTVIVPPTTLHRCKSIILAAALLAVHNSKIESIRLRNLQLCYAVDRLRCILRSETIGKVKSCTPSVTLLDWLEFPWLRLREFSITSQP